MIRVHRIYTLQRFVGPTALKAYTIVVGFALLGKFVHVASVAANMPSLASPVAFVQFWFGAIAHTEFVVQAVLLGLALAVLFFARDVFRDVRHIQLPFFAH